MNGSKTIKTPPHNVLLNGCFRSGTTLLDKLLHAHPEIIMASQPFPALYSYLKEIYLRERDISFRYPLDHMFKQSGYSKDDFSAFLETYVINDYDIDAVFDKLEQESTGLRTPQIKKYRQAIIPGTFLEVYQQFNNCLHVIFDDEKAPVYVGGKEAFVEEYIPFLLEHGVKVIVIIRDPRDVVASVYNSIDVKHMGENRPLLFLLRAWRKSIAYALAYEDDPNLTWITYEQLVADTQEVLQVLTDFLRLESFPDDAFKEGIFNQTGSLWKSNSSFKSSLGLNTASIGQFQDRLNNEIIAYVESACYPEMRAIGYSFSILSKYSPDALMSFREGFEITHEKFEDCKDYSYSPDRIADECERIRLLMEEQTKLSDDEIQNWFILPEAFLKLRLAIDNGYA